MEGMEEIVASVSGYHGSERNKLIKLISSTGASYVGALTRSTTHLVCWKYEGEKYQLAKIFGTKIVNHQWIEDCIKKGKRIPEKSYSLLSGQQVGSIALDVPAIPKQLGVLGKKKLVLNGSHKSCTDPVIDIEYEITEHHDWDDRLLFTKNGESSKSVSKSSRKQKKRAHDVATTRDTISPDPPRSSRRLVKTNASIYLADNGNRSPVNEILSSDDNVASTSNHFLLRNDNEASTVGTDEEGPRDPFTNQNYSEVEASDVPDISNQLGVSGKKKLVRNGRQKSCTDPVIDIEYEITEHHDWDDRLLFTKDGESSKGVSKSSRKQKKRVHDGTTTKDTISPDPTRSSRRLVKLNRYLAESLTDTGNRSLANESLSANDNVASTSNHFSFRNENEASTCGTDEGPRDAFTNQRNAGNHNYSEVEASGVPETGDEDLVLQREETVFTPERAFQDAENVNEKLKMAEQAEEPARNTASSDPSCVICWTRFSSTRGVLPCKHRFCFSCIQNWADCLVTKGKTSTCPLCKASFMTITRVEEADCMDQKIYSQTVPCASSTQDIFILPDGLSVFNPLQAAPSEPACCQCHNREPEELLIHCDVCHVRCIHRYCLDPLLLPWVCSSCKDFRLFYNRY